MPKSHRGPGRGIRSAEPGAWPENLTSEKRSAIAQIIGPKLRELGYEPSRRFRKNP